MSYVILPLLDEYFQVAQEPKRKSNTSKIVDKLPVDDLRALVKKLSKDNVDKQQTISLLKKELNELYLKYDAMCAAFGEMNHFVQEAAKVPGRHSIEK